MIGALVAPSGGEIVVDGEGVAGAPPPKIGYVFQGAPPPKVGYVFQKDTVFPWRTVDQADLASLTPSISFALIGVVVGEFIGGESGGGLGYLIIQSLGTLNAADMMVVLLVLGVIGIVLALRIKQVETRLLRWRPEHQKH